MSTMTFAPSASSAFAPKSARASRPAARATGALRLTRRGRVVFLLGFLALAAALMVTLSGPVTAALSGGAPAPVRVVEVGPGDTLYDIASTVAKPGQVQQMVWRIEQLNSLSGPQLQIGQKLAVPAK